jgi:hypothetical protein
MPAPQIRITKTKELKNMLEILKAQFALLSESEILKLALSDFFRRQEEERIRQWEASLPLMELTDEEQEEITKGIMDLERMEKGGALKPMTVEEIMKEITS